MPSHDKKVVLSLDMGGTAVKAGLFVGDTLERISAWPHEYKDCGLSAATDHLIREAKCFCDQSVDAVGLSLAGLIATDNTLFRSTVLTSLEDSNIGELLKDALGATVFSVDNDADCGAKGEYHFAQHDLFYAVCGSGIGSSYVDQAGEIKYLVRINKSVQYSDEMNHTISDVGLKILIPRERIYQIFWDYGVRPPMVDQVLTPANRNDHKGLQDEGEGIYSGRLGSAVGVRNVLEILWKGNFYSDATKRYYTDMFKTKTSGTAVDLEDLYSERQAAKPIAELARQGEPFSTKAYHLMGIFLGMVISEAQKILFGDLGRFPQAHFAGQIMAAGDLFLRDVRRTIRENDVECESVLSEALQKGQNANLWGAYLSVNPKISD